MKANIFRSKKMIAVNIAILIVICTLFYAGYHFYRTHFLWQTVIDGIDCSFLSVEDTVRKINTQKGKESVEFIFVNGKTYNATFSALGTRVDESKIQTVFTQQHEHPDDSRKYSINAYCLVDVDMVKGFLKNISELREENMTESQNAYIVWDGTAFYIHEEIIGNTIDFEEALILSIKTIANNENVVNFSTITNLNPGILTSDLTNELEELNSVLYTNISYELSNGSIYNLDSNVIGKWVYQDDNDKFKFDCENGIIQFVEELSNQVVEANSVMQFNTTGLNTVIAVNVPVSEIAKLDQEAEINRIKTMLGSRDHIYLKPIYDRTLFSEKFASYVELDISRQHLWFYLNGTLLFDTDCVTGNVRDHYDTPTGVYFLTDKVRNATLRGYNKDGSKYESPVEYWMPFYRGYGLHDASWRSTFGGEIYKTNGSHGCVNLPVKKARQLYENIDFTMPIIIYKSEQ